MRRARALAIVNPAAGNGTGAKIATTIAADLAAAGLSVDVVTTPAAGEAARLASHAVEDGYDQVISVGGDGTANEVANGLVGTEVALGLYPIGSGNDFARALGYPRKRSRIAAFLAAARARRIDVGEVNGRVFLNAAGVGIDGHVAERVLASSRVVGPTLGYMVGSLVSIATYRPREMRVRIDGTSRAGRHLLIVAANGTHFGSGMHVAPDAKLDDGLLDIVVGGDLGRWSSIVALAKLYRGTHVDGRTILAFRAKELDVDFDEPQPMQADGEALRISALRIRARPRSLTVLAR
ncbi:MAG TPA: diacylglycerol kinase family protein [Candidatus Limnocylindrales bacterium]|nr:diacylglycerol kinase family protein [Candidatus Limnocylindrales bacterium]